MKEYKQQGFSVVEIIAVIVTVIVVAFGVWRVYEGNKLHQTATPPSSQHQDPNAGYVVIKEWNVRFKLVDNLKDVEYKTAAQSEQFNMADGVAAFSTKEIAAFGGSCDVENGGAPLGQLVRSKSLLPKNPPIGDPLTHIGNYYFYYVTPQSSCSNDSNAKDLQLKTLNPLFKPSIKTLEAAES